MSRIGLKMNLSFILFLRAIINFFEKEFPRKCLAINNKCGNYHLVLPDLCKTWHEC